MWINFKKIDLTKLILLGSLALLSRVIWLENLVTVFSKCFAVGVASPRVSVETDVPCNLGGLEKSEMHFPAHFFRWEKSWIVYPLLFVGVNDNGLHGALPTRNNTETARKLSIKNLLNNNTKINLLHNNTSQLSPQR